MPFTLAMGAGYLLAYIIIIYFVVQFAVGVGVARLNTSKRNFFVGDRNLPTTVLAMSVFATWFGAESCIGSASAVFNGGLSASKGEPFVYAFCILIAAIVIAPRIWNDRYTTLSDFFRERFGPKTEALGALVMIPSSLIWAGAQTRAFGQILATTFEIDLSLCIILATFFVVMYTTVGGMMADIFTDTLQGIVLAIGLIMLMTAVVFSDLGASPFQLVDSPERLRLIHSDRSIFENLDRILIPLVGSIVSQELIAKILAAKNPGQARQSALLGSGLYLVIGLIPLTLGLMGPLLLPDLRNSEEFLPTLASKFLHPSLHAVFVGALISAILSTIDSTLLAVSALFSQNLSGIRRRNEKLHQGTTITDQLWRYFSEHDVLFARLCLLASGFISMLLALSADSVHEMVSNASSFGTTGLTVVTFFGLLSRSRCSELPALICLSGGVLMTVILQTWLRIEGAFTINIGCLSIAMALLIWWDTKKTT